MMCCGFTHLPCHQMSSLFSQSSTKHLPSVEHCDTSILLTNKEEFDNDVLWFGNARMMAKISPRHPSSLPSDASTDDDCPVPTSRCYEI
jgi:hypothetical protein